jgi:hypothetical protein
MSGRGEVTGIGGMSGRGGMRKADGARGKGGMRGMGEGRSGKMREKEDERQGEVEGRGEGRGNGGATEVGGMKGGGGPMVPQVTDGGAEAEVEEELAAGAGIGCILPGVPALPGIRRAACEAEAETEVEGGVPARRDIGKVVQLQPLKTVSTLSLSGTSSSSIHCFKIGSTTITPSSSSNTKHVQAEAHQQVLVSRPGWEGAGRQLQALSGAGGAEGS